MSKVNFLLNKYSLHSLLSVHLEGQETLKCCRVCWPPWSPWTHTKVQFFGIPILGKFRPKNRNWQFKLKFGINSESNMQNSIVMWTFSVLDQKYRFWENLVSKTQSCFRWNSVLRLIWICRIHWMHWMYTEYTYSLFSFSSRSPLFV